MGYEVALTLGSVLDRVADWRDVALAVRGISLHATGLRAVVGAAAVTSVATIVLTVVGAIAFAGDDGSASR